MLSTMSAGQGGWAAAAGLPLLTVMLVLGGVAKLLTVARDTQPGNLSRLGPAVLVPERHRGIALIICAVSELLLAGGVLFWGSPLPLWGAVAFFTVATYVLWDLRRRAPDVGCGCFGEVSSTPVGLRAIGRAALLAVVAAMSVLAAPEAVPGLDLLRDWSWQTSVWAGAELALLLALSPELEVVAARLRHRLPCERRSAPPERPLARLRSSGEWRRHAPMLDSTDPVDSWRELCWRFFVYSGRDSGGAPVDVVFAVYLNGRRPAVRSAIVAAEGGDENGDLAAERTGPLPESTPVSAAR